jgi:hypothetical protein
VLSRLNLTAVLVALAFLDLLVDRLFSRVFVSSSSGGGRVLALAGGFVSYLAGALALLVFATSFLNTIRRRELYPRSMRLVISVLAFVFVLLLTACLAFVPVPHRWFVQLKTAYAFFGWLTAVAIWRASVGIRPKLGITLFALPAVLHTAALFVSEMGWGRAGTAADLARIGELSAFLAAGAAPLLLLPHMRGMRLAPLSWALGLGAAAVVTVALFTQFDLLHVLALYGLRLDIPPPTAPGTWGYSLLLVLAVLGTFLLVVPSMAGTGGDRLIAYGALLVVSAGYQIASPGDLGIAACGLLALALGITRREGDEPAPATPAPVPVLH